MTRHITSDGLALIKQFESFAPHAYRCPAGVLTIGYGHMVREPGLWQGGISEAEAEHVLQSDVAFAEETVTRLIAVPLAPPRFDALVSFCFNLGAGALQRSALRRKVNRGEHASVPDEFLRWVWAGGRRLPGLIRRREAEAALYAAG